jgi:Domain of unknown function (DUF1840)
MIEFSLADLPAIVMLQIHAEEYFSIIGRKHNTQEKLEGAMLAEDLHDYLVRLNKSILEDEKYPQDTESVDENNHTYTSTRVTLKQRTYPLRTLIEQAIVMQKSIFYKQV